MNSKSGHGSNLRDLIKPQDSFEHLKCSEHPSEIVRGICMFPGPCAFRQLCRTCRKSHPEKHLQHYEEIKDFLSGSMIKEASKSIEVMLQRISAQNQNLNKLFSVASERINLIMKDVKMKVEQEANALKSHLAELIDRKTSQNALIRDELISAQSDFMNHFNLVSKSYGRSATNTPALEEVLHLYNFISSNYINNPELKHQLYNRCLDDSELFNDNAIKQRIESVATEVQTLVSEMDNYFVSADIFKFNEHRNNILKLTPLTSFSTGHENIVIGALEYIPTLNYLITGGAEGSIRLWNLETTKIVAKTLAHKGSIYRIKYIIQKDMIVTGGEDGEVKLWKILNNSFEMVGNISYGNYAMYAVHYLVNGNILSTAGNASNIQLWEMIFAGSEPRSRVIKTTAQKINSLCSLDHAKYLIAGTGTGHILVYYCDITEHELMYSLEGHRADVYGLDIDYERNLLVSGSDDGSIRVWTLDQNRGKCIRIIRKEGTKIRSLVFLYQKEVVLSTFGDTFIRAYNTTECSLIDARTNPSKGGVLVRLPGEEIRVVSAFCDNIQIWNFT